MDIYKINMTLRQAFNCTNEKGICEKSFFFKLPILPLSTLQLLFVKNTRKYDSIGYKKEKKAGVRIKRVKSHSYLTHGQSCKT